MNPAALFTGAEGLYLLNHSVGLLPVSTPQVLQEKFFRPWQKADADIWTHWLAAIEKFRQHLARLLNTHTSQVCPQSNLSSALTKIMTALPAPASGKKTLLLSEEDFPSLGFVLDHAREWNLQLKFVPASVDTSDADAWMPYLTSEVFLALFTHVQSNNGRRLPIDTLTRKARERDIVSVVDVAQSAGVIPIDVASWEADFVIGSCVKWLCGGPGAGYLWIDKDLISRLQPRDVGWFSHCDPFEFDIHHFRYADDALRFWGGTPDVAPFVVAANSMATLLDIGIDRIHHHNAQCKAFMCEHLDAKRVLSPDDPARQSGTLIVVYDETVASRLRNANVHFDTRKVKAHSTQAMRLSPHIYTNETSLHTVVDCLCL